MANVKKTTTTTEEVIEETPKNETPKEQEIDYKKDIQGKTEERIIKESENPPAKEEAPTETPKEDETETIEFDPEELKRQAKEEARQEMANLLSGKTEEQKKEAKDEYDDWAKQVFEKEGRQPNWKEAADFIKEKAKSEIRAEQEAKLAEEEKKKGEEAEAQKLQEENVNRYVDSQFEQLYSTNRFPKIENKDDPNDRGVVFRRALSQQTMEINRARLDKGLPTKTLVEVFFTEFKPPYSQPAGADAPISALNNGTPPTDNGEELNYIRDVKNARSFFDILMNRK